MKRFLVLFCIMIVTGAHSAGAAPEKQTAAPAAKTPSVKTEKVSIAPSGLSGKVVESMNAGGYTYVCLEKAGKKTWIAIPESKVTVGKEMSFQPGQTMANFKSKTLNRTFDEIIFSAGPIAAEPAAASPSMPSGHPPVNSGAASAAGSKSQTAPKDANVKVEKAAGANAYTVADIYAKRIELNKKTVKVKGKVVKVSEGIMGRNWIHIQDGTGDQQKGTHNLVVTMQDMAAVNDVVTVTGTMSKDRDFGAGYLYKVIVEDAKVSK
ncbi:MAG: DNA-binding protein [Nitrospirota bacterium]|nr:DNA-binding protein [Nitrospirota bacterium]